jgi:protein required for attachment to host cells
MPGAEPFLLPNTPTLICACSATLARGWLSPSRHGEWSLELELKDEDATLSEREIVSDKPGRSFDRMGKGRHAMEPGTRARDEEKRRFARRIGDRLGKAVARGEADHLVLLAGPKFLGLLREELGREARDAVVFEASKNLSALDEADVRKYFG